MIRRQIVNNLIHWTVESNERLSPQDLADLSAQQKHHKLSAVHGYFIGYHPAMFGQWDLIIENRLDKYVYTWKSKQ